MANLWYTGKEGAQWASIPVPDNDRYVLVEFLPRSNRPVVKSRRRILKLRHPGGVAQRNQLLLVRLGAARNEHWFAVQYPGVRLLVNGRLVPTPLSPLRDRDLIGLSSGRRYWIFTTERLVRIEPFQGSPRAFCPRCKQSLDREQPVVICPGCRTAHHQDEAGGLPCWTYADTCSQCDWSTNLGDDVYRWTPNEL